MKINEIILNDVNKNRHRGPRKPRRKQTPFHGVELDESAKNTHLEHVEDEILNLGQAGITKSTQILRGLLGLLAGSSNGEVKITTKWDGAPAIFAGTDPSDGKFFVGTKGVFNKNAKLNKSFEDIDANHEGDGLNRKLKFALKYLKELNIKGVLQGDMLWAKGDLESKNISGQKYITFKPNTLTYAVPEGSDLAKQMQNAEVGVVWHTSYEGDNIENMNASFGFDSSELSKTSNVWFDDAIIKDYSGIANFTKTESKKINELINTVEGSVNSIDFSVLSNLPDIGKPNVIEKIKAQINKYIKEPTPRIEKDPQKLYSDLLDGYKSQMDTEISKLKNQDPETKSVKTRLDRIANLTEYLTANKNELEKIYKVYVIISEIKNQIKRKLDSLDSIDSFVETENGYEVSPAEGFVAVDRMGDAVKIVDRLDFSAKNFSKPKADKFN